MDKSSAIAVIATILAADDASRSGDNRSSGRDWSTFLSLAAQKECAWDEGTPERKAWADANNSVRRAIFFRCAAYEDGANRVRDFSNEANTLRQLYDVWQSLHMLWLGEE